jgi:hypothetical protein
VPVCHSQPVRVYDHDVDGGVGVHRFHIATRVPIAKQMLPAR